MPFDAEEMIQSPIQDYLRNSQKAKLIMDILSIEDIHSNYQSVYDLVESSPKNSSDEDLIDHIAKYVKPDYQPEAPSFTVLD